MHFTELPVIKNNQFFPLDGFSFADILAPSIQKGKPVQTHYLFRSTDPSALSFQINLADAEESCKAELEKYKKLLSINADNFPYGFAETQWWQYCLAPHSYLQLGGGRCQVGLNLFNRFLHLDVNMQTAQLIDPEIGNELLSATNWFDPEKEELCFASWPIEDTVRRMLNPRNNVHVTIWKLSINNGDIEKIWCGDLGDSLHQLSLNSDRRFLILTELGLRIEEPITACAPDQSSDILQKVQRKGVVPSKIIILDLKNKREWQLPMPTAGHVEFDPISPDICYLSGHNIGLFGIKVGIFGSGKIQKFHLSESGPKLLGEFIHPLFHRITTHIVFRHRTRTLIGVSGYPGTIFLIDADTMELYKTIKMETHDIVDVSQIPHICRQDSYGIAASQDGEAIMAAGTGFVKIIHIDKGQFVISRTIDNYGPDCCFTGHLGNFDLPFKA